MSGCMCVLCGHPPKVVMHQVPPPMRPSTTPTTATGARRKSQLQQQINPCIAVPNLMATAAPLNASHPPRAGDDDQCSTPPVIEISHDHDCSLQLPMTPSTTRTTATGARRKSQLQQQINPCIAVPNLMATAAPLNASHPPRAGDDDQCSTPPVIEISHAHYCSLQLPMTPSTTRTTATGARRKSQLQQQINPCIAVPNLMATAAPLNASHPPRAGDDDQCSTPPVIEISHDHYCSLQLPMTPSTTRTTATGARRKSQLQQQINPCIAVPNLMATAAPLNASHPPRAGDDDQCSTPPVIEISHDHDCSLQLPMTPSTTRTTATGARRKSQLQQQINPCIAVPNLMATAAPLNASHPPRAGDDDQCSTPPVIEISHDHDCSLQLPMTPSTTRTTATGARRKSQLQQQINPCIAVPNLMATAAPLNASHPPRAGDDDQCSTPPVIEISHDHYCSLQLPMTPSTTRTTATGARRKSQLQQQINPCIAVPNLMATAAPLNASHPPRAGDDDQCSTPPVIEISHDHDCSLQLPMTPSTTRTTATGARRKSQLQQQINPCIAVPNLMATAAPLNASHPPRAGDDDQCSTPPVIEISHDYRPQLCPLPIFHDCSEQLPMTPSTTRTTATGARRASHVLKPVPKKLALTPAEPRRASGKKRLWSIFTRCLAPSPSS